MGKLNDWYRAGLRSAKIKSHKDAFIRALQFWFSVWLAASFEVAWWLKVLIFLAVMFVIGVVVA
jgi:hypothetical protein